MLAVLYGEYMCALRLGESLYAQDAYAFYDFESLYFFFRISDVALYQQQDEKPNQSLVVSTCHNFKTMHQIYEDSSILNMKKPSLLKTELSSVLPWQDHSNIIQLYKRAITLANVNHQFFDESFSNES
jgi:hypothetical protein